MRFRWWTATAVAAVGIAAGSLLVSTASGAGPAASSSKPRPSRQALAADVPPTGIDNHCHPAVKITNLTPYSWKLVGLLAYRGFNPQNSLWLYRPPETLDPGQSAVVQLDAVKRRTTIVFSIICDFDGAYFTYEADTLKGHEFLTVRMGGHACFGPCINETPKYSNEVFDTTEAVNPYPTVTHLTPDPEIGWTASDYHDVGQEATAPFVFTFQTKGNYTLDASTSAEARLADLINAMCSGAEGTTCEFTASGAPTYGPGKAKLDDTLVNCGEKLGESDWEGYGVEVKRTATVSAGGELTAAAGGTVAGVVDLEVSVFTGFEHDWSQTESVKFTGSVEVPRGYIGWIWDAPEVGIVYGTLVVRTQLASYTITNFRSERTGVTPDPQTPPFVILTKTRKMTDAEFKDYCSHLTAVVTG